jgi:hypothetical protein
MSCLHFSIVDLVPLAFSLAIVLRAMRTVRLMARDNKDIPVVDIVTPKEEPQIFKIKLPDASHLSMPIYSRGNNEEYLANIVVVLQVIEQKGLPNSAQCLPRLL